MIIVRIFGGLGNQMFQYAIGRHLAILHNTDLVLDLNWYKHRNLIDTPRIFGLDHFQVVYRRASKSELILYTLFRINKIININYNWRGITILDEKVMDFNKVNFNDNIYLNGYWQSYRYFEDIADVIKFEFDPALDFTDSEKNIMNMINNKNSVSIHVRRGDYVSKRRTNLKHGTCSPLYYKQAINIISSKVSNLHFFVFSDDINWVKENMIFPTNTTFVEKLYTSELEIRDLRLMKSCKHNIIANSSFSWWAAWLNSNLEKIVIAPKQWFTDDIVSNNLILKNWEIL